MAFQYVVVNATIREAGPIYPRSCPRPRKYRHIKAGIIITMVRSVAPDVS